MWLAISKNYKKVSKIKGRLKLLFLIDLAIWIGDAKVLNDIKVSILKLKSKISKEQRVSRWYWLPWSGVLEAPWTNCLLPTLYVYYQVLVLPGGFGLRCRSAEAMRALKRTTEPAAFGGSGTVWARSGTVWVRRQYAHFSTTFSNTYLALLLWLGCR